MFTLDFGKIYVLNVKKIKKILKKKLLFEKKNWRETRETGKLFPWETGKQQFWKLGGNKETGKQLLSQLEGNRETGKREFYSKFGTLIRGRLIQTLK